MELPSDVESHGFRQAHINRLDVGFGGAKRRDIGHFHCSLRKKKRNCVGSEENELRDAEGLYTHRTNRCLAHDIWAGTI
jgi:hypothetical protein